MESRTKNAKKNIYMAVSFQLINVVVKFVMRTVFAIYLGREYMGISGVFTNVISILSLTELGLGTAIIYDMYKPIAEGDNYKVNQLVKFYKYVYCIVGIVILIAGLLLIPFLDIILKDIPNVKHICLIYVLFLIKTVTSYFFAQYTTVLSAYQKNYINTRYRLLFSVLKTIIEIFVLVTLQNYIIYLLVEIMLEILCNYCIYRKTISLYPFIKQGVENLKKSEIKKIWNNAEDMFSIRIGGTIVNTTDNLIISTVISTVLVGIYSNYSLIVQILLTSTVLIQNAIMAGVGNVCVSNDKEKKYKLFKKVNFIYGSIFVFVFSALIVLIQPFMVLWLGKEYQLNWEVVLIIIVNCYLSGMHQPIELYILADGLFKYFRWKPWIEAIINLVVSIVLSQKFGIIGVVLGTTVSHICTTCWYDSYIVFKFSLKQNFIQYWKSSAYFSFIAILSAIMSLFFGKLIEQLKFGIIQFALKAIITLSITLAVWLIFVVHTDEFKYLCHSLKRK